MHTDTKTGQWQIVPTEPTPAMLSAAFDGMVTDMDAMRHAARTKEVAATYARMLAAAPITSTAEPVAYIQGTALFWPDCAPIGEPDCEPLYTTPLAAPSTSAAFLEQFKADPTGKWPGWMKDATVEKSASFPKPTPKGGA